MSSKAKRAAKSATQGSRKNSVKVRTKVHFYKPKTLTQQRKPMYSARSAKRQTKMDKYRILKFPLTTESAMKKIEGEPSTASARRPLLRITLCCAPPTPTGV